jgi:hypothetical protein
MGREGEAEDYDRAVKFLSLLGPNTKASTHYFDERAPVPCRIVDIDHRRSAPRRQPGATRMNASAEPIDALRRRITKYLVLARRSPAFDPFARRPEAKGPARGGGTPRGAKARAPVWAMSAPTAKLAGAVIVSVTQK